MATYTIDVDYGATLGRVSGSGTNPDVDSDFVLNESIADLATIRDFSYTEKALFDFVKGLVYTVVPSGVALSTLHIAGVGFETTADGPLIPSIATVGADEWGNVSYIFSGVAGTPLMAAEIPNDTFARRFTLTFSGAPSDASLVKNKDFFVKFRLTLGTAADHSGTNTPIANCPTVTAWMDHPKTCQTVTLSCEIPDVAVTATSKYLFLEATIDSTTVSAATTGFKIFATTGSHVELSPGVVV